MAISTYATLLTAYAEASGDANTSSGQVDNFIQLAEARFNRTLRHRRMETTATIDLTSGVGSLPPDYLEWRSVVYAGNPRNPLECTTLDYLELYNPSGISGRPDLFAITGDTIKVSRQTSDNLSMAYYQRIPALTSSSTTNWLLTYAPDAYYYGVLLEYAIMYRDQALISQYGEATRLALEMLKQDDRSSKWARAGLRLQGPTP
jgi:hypothetical protein